MSNLEKISFEIAEERKDGDSDNQTLNDCWW